MKPVKNVLLVLVILALILGLPQSIKAKNVKTKSPEFAAQSETEVYEIDYSDPQEVAEKLKADDIKVKPILSENLIIVQALPAKMQEIEKRIKKLDSPQKPYQVQYNLFIVELKAEMLYNIGLDEIEVDSEDYFQFFTQKDLIEMAGQGVISFLRASAFQSESSFQKTAEPSLAVGIDSTASLNIGREIISADTENEEEVEQLNLEISPEEINSDTKSILTTINYSSNTFMKTELNTTMRTSFRKPELIALFSKNTNKKNSSVLRSKKKTKGSQYFALYLAASPVGSLPNKNSQAFDMGSLGNILKERSIQKTNRYRLDIRYGEKYNLDFNYQSPINRLGMKVEVNKDPDKNLSLIEIGADYHLIEGLKFGSYYQGRDQKENLKFGFNDRLKIKKGFNLAAGYYPVTYNLNSNKFSMTDSWWFKTEFNYKRLFLDLTYEKIETNDTKSSWEGLVGIKIFDPVYLTAGYKKNREDQETYIGGITIRNW